MVRINFNNYDEFLQSLNLQNNSRLVLIDKNGVKIGDSTENETSILKESHEKKECFQILLHLSRHQTVNQEVL